MGAKGLKAEALRIAQRSTASMGKVSAWTRAAHVGLRWLLTVACVCSSTLRGPASPRRRGASQSPSHRRAMRGQQRLQFWIVL